jgi:hypothetical protein
MDLQTDTELQDLTLIQKKVRKQDAAIDCLPELLRDLPNDEYITDLIADMPEEPVSGEHDDDDEIIPESYSAPQPYIKEIPSDHTGGMIRLRRK